MRAALSAFLVFAALLHAASCVHYAQKVCRTEDDCDWDQCCIQAQTRFPGFNGICSPPTQRGEFCNPDPSDRTEDGRYRVSCPCDEGLSCQSKEEEGRVVHICQP